MNLKKRFIALTIFIIILAILIGILIYMENCRGTCPQVPYSEEQNFLPRVGTFEKFKELIKGDERYNYSNSGIMIDSAMSQESAKGGTTDYSGTNVQTQGVDESDIIKTDGRYIYYVTTSKVVIVDAISPSDLKIVKEIKYSNNDKEYFNPIEVYVKDNVLVVIGTNTIYLEDTNNR